MNVSIKEVVYVKDSLLLFLILSLSLAPSPRLSLSREVVDVGALVTHHQIHSTSFSLSNIGSCSGTFFIDVSPLPPWISFQPASGLLEPLQTTHIQVCCTSTHCCMMQ